jgi:hypothetical protein
MWLYALASRLRQVKIIVKGETYVSFDQSEVCVVQSDSWVVSSQHYISRWFLASKRRLNDQAV